jgi:hypothetical protein
MFQGSTSVIHGRADYLIEDALSGARAEAKLNDFGDDSFLEPLDRLVDGVRKDVRFTKAGLLNFKATIQRFLVNRLRFQRDVTAHPEILDEDVCDPIIVLGMPRTGTTKLQRLMSADARSFKLSLWRMLNPAPFPEEGIRGSAGRKAFALLVEEAAAANADFTVSHELKVDEAEEDSYLLLMSFDYLMLYIIFPSSSYVEWVRNRPRYPPHAFEKKMLQYLQWQAGGRQGRRWILKNPGHVGNLNALREVFPQATYVHSRRDMIDVIPSYCRLIEALLAPLIEPFDLKALGRSVIDYWAPEIRRYDIERRELGHAIDILDVPYLDIVRDPKSVVRGIYSRARVEFTSEAEAAMNAWLRANEQYKHGKASYSLERYGLSAAAVSRAFDGTSFQELK